MGKAKVMLDICTICNSKCKYCTHQVLSLLKPRLMSLEDFSEITTILAREEFLSVYLYMSGEPLLHTKIFEFLELANEKGIECSIGSKLNTEIDVNKFRKALEKTDKVCSFEVTVDALDQEIHSKIAPGISTKLVLKNLEILKKLNEDYKNRLKLVGIVVVNKFNFLSVKKIYNKLRSIGCNTIHVKAMGCIIPYVTTPEFLEGISEMVIDKSRFRIEGGKVVTKGRMGCMGEPAVDIEGNVSVCCHDMLFSLKLGNIISENSLDKIMSSSAYKDALRKRGRHLFCTGCN
jgi:sulfatase maturation enzyme AslB (radical SAM superfamily)